MSWHEWYPPTAPRPTAVNGKERKKFGTTWWGKKWIEIVENNGDSQRMSRGRAYARAESVYNIKLAKGLITAKVRGNYGTYSVTVKIPPMDNKQWHAATARIKNSHALGALLNNELPQDMDDIMGMKLIDEELKAECSCPDYAMPCKHIAALYYILADEIDKAPQILFALRGIEKDKLFELLTTETPIKSCHVKKDVAKTPARTVSNKQKTRPVVKTKKKKSQKHK
jgi:uncharacterized Zn finger protein